MKKQNKNWLRKEQLKIGVMLEDPHGRIRQIVAIKGNKYQLTHKHDFKMKGKWWTLAELQFMGDRIVYRP